MCTVSIVMPVYNGEEMICRAVDSVKAQTYEDWELIIVDDGSTDRTLQVCTEYSITDKRIKVYHQANTGVSGARNSALEKVSGRFVTFIDCDDAYPPNRIEKMVSYMDKNNCDFVYADYYEFRQGRIVNEESDGKKVSTMDKEEAIDNILLHEKMNGMWKYILKSDIAKTISFKPLKFCEDLFYILEYLQKTNGGLKSEEKLYFYYRTENSMTQNSRNRKYLPDFMKIPQEMYKYFSDFGLSEKKYCYKLAQEYAYSSVRIRKCVSYKEFVQCMNQVSFREGLKFARFDVKCIITSILFLLVKYRIYFPYQLIRNRD